MALVLGPLRLYLFISPLGQIIQSYEIYTFMQMILSCMCPGLGLVYCQKSTFDSTLSFDQHQRNY